MRNFKIVAAIVLFLGSVAAQAIDVSVTNMDFYPPGTTTPAFVDPLASGTVGSGLDGTGQINSGTDFFSNPWVADQQVHFDTAGSHTWAGTSASGAFSYTFNLSENQIAIGLYFDWTTNLDIPVLAVFDTDGTPVNTDGDASPGTAMQTAPFPGQTPAFTGTMSNFQPIVKDETTSTTTDMAIDINVIANDTDFDNPIATATVNLPATSTQGFALTDNGNGTIHYAPTGGYQGQDTFEYTLTDVDGNTSSTAATVTINITATSNAAPVANDTGVSTAEDTALDINVTSVASDGDSDPLTYLVFDAVATGLGGTVAVNGANTVLTYTPPANLNGTDTFTYSVTDGITGSNTATITVI